jgi:hypothetical protein
MALESRLRISYNNVNERGIGLSKDAWGYLRKPNIIFFALFFLGAWIRSLDVWRPVDGRIRESWRECDYAAVARNFYREGMDILYPRIDWRGDGPGYAEM